MPFCLHFIVQNSWVITITMQLCYFVKIFKIKICPKFSTGEVKICPKLLNKNLSEVHSMYIRKVHKYASENLSKSLSEILR
jgi:hypothetical protein